MVICPACGHKFVLPYQTRKLHWSNQINDLPLCRVDRGRRFDFATKIADVTCKSCLKEIAYRHITEKVE